MTINEKLDNFYTSVIESATAQSVKIIEEYNKSLETNYEERKEAALKRAQNTYRVETDHIRREKNRKLSHISIDIKRKVLERSAEITDLIFQEVEQKLLDFMKSAAYTDYLKTKIKDAVDFARGEEIIIYINPSDKDIIPKLEKVTGITLTLSNRDFLGGMRAVIPSRTILIDHSFVTKLKEAKNNFNCCN